MAKKKQQYWFGRDNTPDPGWWGWEESTGTVNNGKGWATYAKRHSGKINKFLSEKLGFGETDNQINNRRAAAARRRLDQKTKTNTKSKTTKSKTTAKRNTVPKGKLSRLPR